MFKALRYTATLLFVLVAVQAHAISSFDQAKVALKNHVYGDLNRGGPGDFYCGCDWDWVGRSGGRVDLESCGYEVRAQQTRAERTEWEHVVPAWVMGHQRQCWQNGGRKNCIADDPVFRVMEADPHNLVISVGEVNADRSNFSFGVLPGTARQHGQCDVKVDFKQRIVEPRDEVKGRVARTYFYIHDRYGLSMSRQDQQLFMAWHKQHPVSEWELERDRHIAKIVGHHNPFVTGERTWTLGHKPSREGLVSALPAAQSAPAASSGEIRGNRNSKVYHLPAGCPSYNAMNASNIVAFSSEAEAQAAGYRKAGNCR